MSNEPYAEPTEEQPSSVWNGPYISVAGTPIIPIGYNRYDNDEEVTYLDLIKQLRHCRQRDWLTAASFWSWQLIYRQIESNNEKDGEEDKGLLQISPQDMLFIPERIAYVALIEHTYGKKAFTKERLYRLGSMIHEMSDLEGDADLATAQSDNRNSHRQQQSPQAKALAMISGDVYLQSRLRSHWGGWLPPLASSWQIFNHGWQSFDQSLSTQGPWQEETLGCNVQQFIQAGAIVWLYMLTKYMKNSDKIHRGYSYEVRITWKELEEIITISPMSNTLLDTLRSHFVKTPRYLRKVAEKHRNPNRKKWSLNPLVKYPIVDTEDGYLVVPAPSYLLGKVSASGLYHMGYDKYREKFTNHLGLRFQDYVSRQLELLSDISGVCIYPEINYGSRSHARASVDFFLTTKDVILLIEVKIYRPIQSVQEGTDEGNSHLQDRIQKAYNQISRTYQDLRSGKISEIQSTSDNMMGLVVTLDRFHLINDPVFDGLFDRPPIPTAVVSIGDLEGAVAALLNTDSVNSQLLKLDTHADNPFHQIEMNDGSARNPIIEGTLQYILPDYG